MTLPAPRLDDRSFQTLVDEAKRYIKERCPEWTDHNVSDPGVTLIEAFAWMTDLMLYRLNRVPERVHLKFLDMIGLSLFPPTAATVDVDFTVSAPQTQPLMIPAGTVVSTRRPSNQSPIEFTTEDDLEIQVADITYVGTGDRTEPSRDITAGLGMADDGFPLFAENPDVGDSLYIGISKSLSRHSVQLRFTCVRGAGTGIRTSAPPIVWEALVGGDWIECDWTDATRGFNVDGTVDVHIPDGHQTMAAGAGGSEVGMIRCRVKGITPSDRQLLGMTPYQDPPRIRTVTGYVTGATTTATNARFIEGEVLGESRGVAGQEFNLQHAPVITSDEAFVVIVSRPPLDEDAPSDGPDLPRGDPAEWEDEQWDLVTSFAGSGPDDRHFILDRATGTLRFGPMIREEDGRPRNYGAIPAKGSVLRVPRYRHGGGAAGNVRAGAVEVLRTSIPAIARVANREVGYGGVDGETVEEATARGPIELRSRNRAVTVEDFEMLTREADPKIRRARCILDDDQPHAVRVLMVPTVRHPGEQLQLDELEPSDETCSMVSEYLDERRLVGTRVRLEPPEYAGLRVRAQIQVEERDDPIQVRDDALSALYRHFDPLVGGRQGAGWEFGRDVRIGEVYSVLQSVAGVDIVRSATISYCDSQDGSGEEDMGDVLELFSNQLVLSREHVIEVVT